MPPDQHRVTLLASDGQHREGLFLWEHTHDGCRLSLEFGGQRLVAEEPDFFETLCRIREQLEPLDLRPYCYGASRNVFPSGMARDMGAGLKAYKLALGQPAQLSDLVDIFESADDIEVVTVPEQQAFFRKWLASPK